MAEGDLDARRVGQQLARVVGVRRGEDPLGGPCSTMRPSLMTATRSAIVRMSARSWVMNSRLRPISARSVSSSSMMAAWTDVERGGDLVADQELRLRRQRTRDGDPLALAAES